ncbi:unnamed protein product [Ranitomeya imitator]|uniref:Exonuclease domain-containing protein n=1 Tax=Ranitomeya imitator TaxID=111125 RepID=A0ABN9M2N7_9NEOB|nr:unnamed protein product [Ranitomeya imitator]
MEWTLDQWKSVLWSDDSKFEIFGSSHRVFVRRRKGNSVHVDKAFLNKYMPQFMRHLHYRIVDVSTVKELCRRWYPADYERAPMKAASHRALDDIRESIKELHFYRQNVFKKVTDEK